MKKSTNNQMLLILLLLVMQGMASVEAQMRMGGTTAPEPNAILDLNANNTDNGVKGLLLPRVALIATTNASPLTAHVKGMYVYNTATANDVLPGVYYNDGTKWVRSGSESNVNVVSADNSVTITYNGASGIDLSVSMDAVGNNLVNSETFITNLTTNNTFIEAVEGIDTNTEYQAGYALNLDGTEFNVNMTTVADSLVLNETFISNLTTNNTFIEAIEGLDTNTEYAAGYALNLDGNEFNVDMTTVADSLVLNETFITNLVDEIAGNITQEFTNSVMANVTIASIDNTVAVTGSGTSGVDLSVKANVVADSIASNIDQTALKDTIINLVKENSEQKKTLVISLDEVIGIQSKMFSGKTTGSSSAITIIDIVPEIAGNPLMSGAFLKINALADLNDDATVINWTLMIENNNIDSERTCTLKKVTISYICDEEIESASIRTYNIAGR